jgi:alpha-glucosidase (family GH31 glycosyl hydrolase)
VYPYLIYFANESTQTAEPIIRPLWMIDNSDEINFIIDDQFIIGDKIIVAPVLNENEFNRDIYLPKGKWIYHGDPIKYPIPYVGPILLKNFSVPLEEVAYFLSTNSI